MKIHQLYVLSTVILCLPPRLGYSCLCPKDKGIINKYNQSKVVFIGNLEEVDTVYVNMSKRGYLPINIYHFEILKIGKGLDDYDEKISVIDYYQNGSCESVFFDSQLGDTVLVFGEHIEIGHTINIILSNVCYHNVILKNHVNNDSLRVINSLDWVKPKKTIKNDKLDHSEKEKNKQHHKKNKQVNWKNTLLFMSLAINIWLLVRIRVAK